MGNSPVVNIWVGINFEKSNTSLEDVFKKLPKEFFDKEYSDDGEQDLIWDNKKQEPLIEKYGCYPIIFSCSDEDIGYGVKVFHHDWDYGVCAFDFKGLEEKSKVKKNNIEKLFKDLGIDEPVGIWVQTNDF